MDELDGFTCRYFNQLSEQSDNSCGIIRLVMPSKYCREHHETSVYYTFHVTLGSQRSPSSKKTPPPRWRRSPRCHRSSPPRRQLLWLFLLLLRWQPYLFPSQKHYYKGRFQGKQNFLSSESSHHVIHCHCHYLDNIQDHDRTTLPPRFVPARFGQWFHLLNIISNFWISSLPPEVHSASQLSHHRPLRKLLLLILKKRQGLQHGSHVWRTSQHSLRLWISQQ